MTYERSLNQMLYQRTEQVFLLQTSKIHGKHYGKRCHIRVVKKSEKPMEGVQC